MYGLGGNDSLDGRGGNDEIQGGVGGDFPLNGAGGNDEVYGGSGNDLIFAEDNLFDYVDCGRYAGPNIPALDSDTVYADPQDEVVSCEYVY
jgi:hypothetical protein